MKLRENNYALPMNPEFIQIIESELSRANLLNSAHHMAILNFRDPEYSPKTGGYHPVEIGVIGDGSISYVTDFAYVGRGECCELAKELDFDFLAGTLEQYGRYFPIEKGLELFGIWQENFCSYYRCHVFQISASCS